MGSKKGEGDRVIWEGVARTTDLEGGREAKEEENGDDFEALPHLGT